MSVATIRQMSDRVSALLEQRLSIRGADLGEKLRRGGWRLPRRVRKAVSVLAEASEMALNPKLQVRVDEARVATAYDVCMRYLGPLGRGGRGGAFFGSVLGRICFVLLVTSVGFLIYLRWRGFI